MGFLFKNFLVPLVFFVVFRVEGAKPAIAVALGIAVIQWAWMHFRHPPVSPFFVLATGFTLVFGVIDLFLIDPRFFRLQPFAQNLILGLVFLGALLFRLPLAETFAAALPERVKPKPGEVDALYYRRVMLAWALYFMIKGFVFLWLAFQVDLGELVVLRSIIGGSSLVLMFAGEIFYRKKIRAHA